MGEILANCAMMHIPPSEAKALSMHDYQALLFRWNEAHSADEIPAMSEDEFDELLADTDFGAVDWKALN